MDQGTEFATRAASGTLSAVLAILVFNMSYAWAAAKRNSWPACLAIAFAAYTLAVYGLTAWAPTLHQGALAVLAALLVAPRLFPPAEAAPAPRARPSDMHWRMAAAAALVLMVTHFSSQLGPRLAGMLAMFPVLASVLVAFSHLHSGAAFVLSLLRGTVVGYYAFAVFCVAIGLTLPALGMEAAFGISLTAAIVVQGLSKVCLDRATKG